MAKLAAQLRDKFFGLVGRITSYVRAGAAHNNAAAGATTEPKSQCMSRSDQGEAPRSYQEGRRARASPDIGRNGAAIPTPQSQGP
ncbi:hypothetical protein ACP70R_003407 [Stipagrostis hirtigluma subsp. patula]